MTQNEENSFITSKFGRTLLTIVAMLLTFAGPTYFIYALSVLLKVDLVASFATGFVLFVIGLVMMRFLVQKRVIV